MIRKSRAIANDMINRLNLAADHARGSLAATGDGRGSNIGEAFQHRPSSRTQRLVGIDAVVPTIGCVEGHE